ncbi:ABC transporter permease [Streptomyces sp. NPDC057743]|uniref:ABC transporter permease n=1 Tax=Streptomyces sp. NPDC057743 TaxID=3346236 RepID=UPI0036CECEAA
MNLFKRAWWRLAASTGKTVLTTGIFLAICTLVLSGFLIQSAAERAAVQAKEKVGAVATLSIDMQAMMAESNTKGSGGMAGNIEIAPKSQLRSKQVDRLGASSGVTHFTYETQGVAAPTDGLKPYGGSTRSADSGIGNDEVQVTGVRDSSAQVDFRNGSSRIVDGKGIGLGVKGNAVLLEKRFADANKLTVGGTIKLRSVTEPGKHGDARDFAVVGIYASDKSSSKNMPAIMDPGNSIYTTLEGSAGLNGEALDGDGASVSKATFTLRDPSDLARLQKEAKALGINPKVYPLKLNDKQFKELTGPISKTAAFATATVWLVAGTGTAILSLITAYSLRERRRELGVLLALGERKPRLLGQHLAEIITCALVAIAVSVPASQVLAQTVGNKLLAGEVSHAKDEKPDAQSAATMGIIGSEDDMPAAEPIDTMDVRLGAGDIATVSAAGLGIAVIATLIPGYRVLRRRPSQILTKGD